MGTLWTSLRERLAFSYGQKLFLLATVPLLLSVTVITWIVANQSRALADREIRALETQLIDAKRDELQNYISIARTAFVNIYGRAAPDDEQAKLEVTRILSAMLYGQDGYFFVFDYDGNNLVAPRQTNLIGQNWSGLDDIDGIPITDEIIRLARTGGGYHEFQWPKPTTRVTAPMIVYVNGLQDWRWAIGTGIFVDDVRDDVTTETAATNSTSCFCRGGDLCNSEEESDVISENGGGDGGAGENSGGRGSAIVSKMLLVYLMAFIQF